MPDHFIIDQDTRNAIVDRGWTPVSDYVVEAGGGRVLCLEGICYYLNASGEFRFLPFD